MEHCALMRQIGNRRYTLVRELGRGGMGVVRADDTVLGRAVAVKELLAPDGIPVSERAVYQERVLREARIAGLAIRHILAGRSVAAPGTGFVDPKDYCLICSQLVR